MNRNKLLVVFIFTDVALLSLYELSKWILEASHLAYRNMVTYTVYGVLACTTLVVFILILERLYKKAREKQGRLVVRILSGIGMAAAVVVAVLVAVFGSVLVIFTHTPEHVVEKDGRTMVACVDSFLQVEVRYYEYVNSFVMESGIAIREDYGNGGYDPFEREEMPKVQRYMYYDRNGKVIQSKGW